MEEDPPKREREREKALPSLGFSSSELHISSFLLREIRVSHSKDIRQWKEPPHTFPNKRAKMTLRFFERTK